MRFPHRFFTHLTFLLTALLSLPQYAHAAEPTVWQARYPLAPNHPIVAVSWQELSQALAPDIDLQLHLHGPRISTPEALEALASGHHQTGLIALASYPEAFPYWALLSELFLIGQDSTAAAAAISELVMLECVPCQDNLARQKLVFLGTYGATGYALIAPTALTEPLSLEGKTVASPGSLWDRLMGRLGATAKVPDGDPRQALADGEVTALIDVPSALLHPALAGKQLVMTRMPLGGYRGGSPLTINRNAWRELSADQRRRVFGAAAATLIRISQQYQRVEQASLAVATNKGATTARSSLLLDGRIRQFAVTDQRLVIDTALARFGVPDAAEFVEQLKQLYDKYATLLGPQTGEAEAIALLQAEIFDRLDPDTYGLE
jgi:TRAP-type C4-dicarboxylate transport system substrate-binding protein